MDNAQRLRTLRKHLKLTQKQMGDRLGASSGSISIWENKKRKIPSFIIKMMNFLEENARDNCLKKYSLSSTSSIETDSSNLTEDSIREMSNLIIKSEAQEDRIAVILVSSGLREAIKGISSRITGGESNLRYFYGVRVEVFSPLKDGNFLTFSSYAQACDYIDYYTSVQSNKYLGKEVKADPTLIYNIFLRGTEERRKAEENSLLRESHKIN